MKQIVIYLLIEIDKSKAKDFEIVATPLCLRNVSKDWSVDKMKNNRITYTFIILVSIMMLSQSMKY